MLLYVYVNPRFILLSGFHISLGLKTGLLHTPERPCCLYAPRCAKIQTQGLCTCCSLSLMFFVSSTFRFLLECHFSVLAQASPGVPSCRTLEFLLLSSYAIVWLLILFPPQDCKLSEGRAMLVLGMLCLLQHDAWHVVLFTVFVNSCRGNKQNKKQLGNRYQAY